MGDFNFNNIKKGPLTTLIGLVLIGVGIYTIIEAGGKVDISEITLITFGVALLPFKDPKI